MKADFWHTRWSEQQIGWHRNVLNPMLEKWWGKIGIEPNAPVLVPLAGKSLDLHWLHEQSHAVLGVELSDIAVNDFFAEAGLTTQKQSIPNFECFTYEKIQFLQGDLFALSHGHLTALPKESDLWAWYDRAALVALPPELRVRYMQHLAELLPTGAVGLLLSFEYPQHENAGPPFSVEEDEVIELCRGRFDCRLLEREMLLDPANPPTAEELAVKPNRYVEKGLTRASESVYRLQRL